MKVKPKLSIELLVGITLFLIILPLVKAEAAAKPKPEGTFTVLLPTLAEEGFLPDRSSSTASPLWECVYDFLIYSESTTLKPIPGILERWDYSKDYRTLTLKVRKGIQFHGGWGELTAEDVKWTFEFNARPTSTNLRAVQLRMIKSMDVVDRYTLVLQLKEPDPMLWLNFCNADNQSLPILCKKYIETVGEEKANRQPIGSGPYRLVEHKLGDYAKFEAVDEHWLVVPEFKYMIMRIVPEDTTRIAMLKTGEADIAMELALDAGAELEKAGVKTAFSKNSLIIFMPFGGMMLPEDKRYVEGYHNKDPWRDIRVREAMNLAIDRGALAKNLYRNLATPASIWATLPGYEKLAPIPYDPKRAKQLLSEAGYSSGFSFKIVSHAKEPQLYLLAQAVAGYWDAIGLKPEIAQGDYATFRDTNKRGKTAGYLWFIVLSPFADWSARLASYELPNAATPLYQSEETKVGIRKVLGEIDSQKREANFRELAQLYRQLYAHVPLVNAPRMHGVSKNVGEWPPGRLLYPKNFIFAKHPKPLNTYRLFTP